MEEIKRRLEFDNVSVQNQMILKLKSEIKKKREKAGIISESTPQVDELKLLFEKCTDSSNILSTSCSSAIIDLIQNGVLDFEFGLRNFLNLVPSAKNLNGIVQAISSLLKLQLAVYINKNETEEFRSPYSLRLPPHPFITVVNNRPDAWPQLIQEIWAMCHSDNKCVRQNSTRLLEPFLKFVLLEPQQSQQFMSMRQSLLRILLHTSTEDYVLDFLIKVLPGFQLNTSESVAVTSQFLIELLPRVNGEKELRTLLRYGFSLCQQSTKLQMGYTMLAETLKECVTKNNPKKLLSDADLVTISSLLVSTPKAALVPVIDIANFALQTWTWNPLVVGMVAMPILVLVTTPSVVEAGNKSTNQLENSIMTLLSTIKKLICTNQDREEESLNMTPLTNLASGGYESQEMAQLALTLSNNDEASRIWLKNLKSCLPKMQFVSVTVTNLVSSVFLVSTIVEVTDLALETLIDIAKHDVSQSPNFLPLMVFKLGIETNWDVKLTVLRSLPRLARQKVCVAPILKTIQSLGTTPRLRPLSLSLMVDLWQLQDRCFPHLLQMIQDATLVNFDLQLARAKAILEICKTRPEQHGTDMLGPLSDILNTCTDDSQAPVAAMALEGLYHLCEAEVIDIKSAWDVLAVKLSSDTRPVVVEKICDLFSLVPDHAVDSPEYQKFVSNTVRNLWLLSQSCNDNVAQAAFQALSMFNADRFKMSHLPALIIEDFVQQAKLISDQQEEGSVVTVDEIWPNIPAVIYVRLLKYIREGSHKGYEAFLTYMVAKEVENLPRGIYHSSLRRQGAASNQGKAVGAIPAFLLMQYQKTKQPGLRPGLAAGLLFSYDPPVDVGRDGRPRKHYIMSHSKNFQQMFTTLLNEVPIQPSEWHRTLVIPQGWTSFMDRLFTAMLEGRVAEIELQVKREHITQADAGDKILAAWLWVRGEIVGRIKNASRGNPGIQSNCVYALAGLAVTIDRYGTSLEKEALEVAESSTEYMSHSHWLTVVMDTIMCLADVNHMPKGALLGLCQQRSADDKLPASILAQASASVALSQIVPILISTDSARILPILRLLLSRLPGTEEESPVLQFHAGLGLGMFMARIFEEHFSDICGAQGMVEIWKCLDKFEECVFSEIDNRQGCLLGLAMTISAMCEEGKTEVRAHVSSVFERLSRLVESDQEKDIAYQAASVCLACVTGAGFSSNIISPEQVKKVTEDMVKVNMEHPKITGVGLALGMMCYSIGKAGHPTIGEVKMKLFTRWMTTLKNKDQDAMVTIACLNGLIALVGSERTLIPVQSNTSLIGGDVNVDLVIHHVTETILKGDNLGIQSNCSWMLGHLYLSACAVAETRASVPPSYSYLPEHSFIRGLTDFLIEAAKQGPESVSSPLVEITLTSLQEEVTRVLPPINWAGLLTPLIRMNFGKEVQKSCLKLAVSQSSSSPTAVMFLSSWITAPLYNTLHIDCKTTLFQALPSLIKSIAPSVIKIFVEKGGSEIILSTDIQAKKSVLQGLQLALHVPDPPESITSVLHQCLESLYKLPIHEHCLMCLFGECFSEVPDNIFDKITTDDLSSEISSYKGIFVRCYLVAMGRQPMAILNSCVDHCINTPNTNLKRKRVLHLLQNTLYQTLLCDSEFTGTLQCVQWFMELLGHSRNITNGVMEISKDVQLSEVLDFLCMVVSSAICLWTSTLSLPLLAVNVNYFSSDEKDYDMSVARPALHCLRVCIESIQINPWDQLSANVIDWLGLLASSGKIRDNTKSSIIACSLMTRHIKDFHKIAVWTKFVHEHI